MNIELKILNSKIMEYLPSYYTPGSAGMDLHACIDRPLIIQSECVKKIPTGLALYIKDSGIAGFIVPRSGLAHKHGIILTNSIGILDSDYQGEIQLSIRNTGKLAYEIQPMQRIAQILFVTINQIKFTVVEKFEESDRGEGGFGSTGNF